jgi:hypothetical protein
MQTKSFVDTFDTQICASSAASVILSLTARTRFEICGFRILDKDLILAMDFIIKQ